MTRFLPLSFAVLLFGCPTVEPEPEPEPEPITETHVQGTLVDRDSDEALADCEVGVERADAVSSDSSGAFELVVDVGAVVHILCPETPLHSFAVPELASIDWTIPVNRGTGQDPATSCYPTMSMDATALGDNGGQLELRVLNATDTASLVNDFYQELTLSNIFMVPEGDYRLYARAFGGDQGGFGTSTLLSCAGDGSNPTIEVDVMPVTLQDLQGTWSGAAAGAEFSMLAYQQLDDADFGWWSQRVDHTSSGNPNGWTLTVAEGIGAGQLDVEACQTVGDSTACVNRLAVDTSGTVAVGDLVSPADVVATLVSGQRLSVSLPVELASGRFLVRIDDWTDPFAPAVLWRGTSYEPSMALPLEWLEEVPAADAMKARVFALDGATFDFTQGYEPTDLPDGWVQWAPGLADVLGR